MDFREVQVESSEDAQGIRANKPKERSDDFLSFLSLFVSTIWDMSTDLHLASVLLGPRINIREPVGSGSSFSITLVEQSELSPHMRISSDKLKPLPGLVAIKKPLLEGDPNKPSNQRVLRAMATELRILRDVDLLAHKNVVSLLGVCWTTEPERPFPVFVLEAAELGDLESFLSHKSLTADEEVRMCIDIAAGVCAIHKKGVIHCDLKPRNILIYKDGRDSFTAKLGDFGSSILLFTWRSNFQLHGGTKAWQAPEIDEISEPDELVKADIYSLGLLMWFLFATDIASGVLDSDAQGLKENKASGELLETANETLASLFTEEAQEGDSEEILLRQCLMSSTLAPQGNERWEAEAVLLCLNTLMHVTIAGSRLEEQEQSGSEPAVKLPATKCASPCVSSGGLGSHR
jgi:serine/threonine protein kinase